MAASSVTGVGPGSADGIQRGSEHTTLGVTHLIGPRIVFAGQKTLSGGVGTVTFQSSLSGAASTYVVIPHAFNSATACYVTSVTNDSSTKFASFALAGGTTDVIHFIVVNKDFTVG